MYPRKIYARRRPRLPAAQLTLAPARLQNTALSEVRQRVMGEEREEGQGSADAFKAIAALCLFTMAAIGGILPRHLQNVSSRVTSSLNSAAGGVFFASAMVSPLSSSSDGTAHAGCM